MELSVSGHPCAAHVFLQTHGNGERSGSPGAEAGSYLSIFAEIWAWCDPDFSEHMHATMPIAGTPAAGKDSYSEKLSACKACGLLYPGWL